ncbi:MAG: ribosome biogenesis GTPase Der [Desulfatitalea sp.]|nr:ribosome biogenesis GTPase Der [Desulfatitalea sp.]NNK01666.1 ribosome biogenesis GTPase Der [Desulfatitalea sp.]
MKPIVAIIGRPNVGKSTLFNRITRRKDAIVDNMPGVTRDRHYGEVIWDDHAFILVDTGGFITGDDDAFAAHIRVQVQHAVAEAEAVVLVLDGKHGQSPYDHDLIQWLRTVSQPVFYVVNKIDGPEQEPRLYDFYALGLEKLHSLSAEHGYGLPDFLDDLVKVLPVAEASEDEGQIRIAVVGRPNVGKSSLINRLLGQERLLVSDVPGTTRDAVDTLCRRNERVYRLIDTAGIRRKAKVDLKLEKFSIIKALKSLELCDVALIVLDAQQGITEQDIKVAGYAHERGCGVIFVANKWDLVDASTLTPHRFGQRLFETARFLQFAPVLTVSALTGQRINKLFALADQVFEQYAMRVGTGAINRIVKQATERNEPPMHKGRRLKFYYTTQVTQRPPTFVTFANFPGAVHFSYQRYLINQIRAGTGLNLPPIRLYFRQRTGKIEFGKWKKNRPRKKTRK